MAGSAFRDEALVPGSAEALVEYAGSCRAGRARRPGVAAVTCPLHRRPAPYPDAALTALETITGCGDGLVLAGVALALRTDAHRTQKNRDRRQIREGDGS
ncbi:hypothetical protein GCM10023238_15710 [Streptomyces heliomycini]